MASIVSAGTTSSTALNMSADTSGVLQLASNNGTTAVTIGTDQSVTFAGSINAPNSFGFKNRIINGAMVIDQRNAGAASTPADAAYTLDRWQYGASQASKVSFQQNKGSVTPPAGFKNYLGAYVSATATVGASDYFQIIQPIEGYNVADLGWGTASASTVTLSFWVYSNLTGVFGGCLGNAAFNRSYPFTYTINSANTWEYKTITIAGETTGTWGSTNAAGINLRLGLGVGSTYSGTAGSWSSSGLISATGATSLMSSTSNYLYVTGVQLEKGSTATSFDYRPYGTELALCQRYYGRFQGTGAATGPAFGVGISNSTSQGGVMIQFPQTMRSAPTISYSQVDLSDISQYDVPVTSTSGAYTSATNSRLVMLASGGGMTQYRTVLLISRASTTGYLEFSAEL